MVWSPKGQDDPLIKRSLTRDSGSFSKFESITCRKCRAVSPAGSRQCSECGYSFLETQISSEVDPDSTPQDSYPRAPWLSPSESEDHPWIGRVIDGRYKVLSVLGEGGFGVVFKVESLLFDDPVIFAMKVLHKELSKNESFRLRFLREARLAMSLSHQGVIQVRELGQTREGMLYFTMDYCEGESLKDRLSQLGFIPVEQSLLYAREILKVLKTSHQKGILHRDLKPGNIFIEEVSSFTLQSGQIQEQIKIGDFGLAKDLSEVDRSELDITHGGIVGSPRYMSPEQAMGDELDARSDLFSVGMILYEMLYGIPPSERQLEDAKGGLVRPSRKSPRQHVPHSVFEVLAKALATDVDLRYSSAEEFLNRIDELPLVEKALGKKKGIFSRNLTTLSQITLFSVLVSLFFGGVLLFLQSPQGRHYSQQISGFFSRTEIKISKQASSSNASPVIQKEPTKEVPPEDVNQVDQFKILPALAGKVEDYFFPLKAGSSFIYEVHRKQRGETQFQAPSRITFKILTKDGPNRVLVEGSEDGQRFWWGLDRSTDSIYQEFLLPNPETGELEILERRTLLSLPKDPTVRKLTLHNEVAGVKSEVTVEATPMVTLHNETFRNCIKVTEWEEGKDRIVVRYYQKFGGEIGHLVYDKKAKEYVYSRILLSPEDRKRNRGS